MSKNTSYPETSHSSPNPEQTNRDTSRYGHKPKYENIYNRLKTYKSISNRDFKNVCKSIISSKGISGNTKQGSHLTSKNNPENLPPFNWIAEAKIYNHNYLKVPPEWITDGVDIIVLSFSLRDIDRPDNIMETFYEMYENARYINLPIEVINVPMDDNKQDMCISYDDQANWFTLMFNDPLIIILQYIYGVTSLPHLVVLKTDGTVVSAHGISDIDAYGKNALITWMSTSALSIQPKRVSKELQMFGPNWRYLSIGAGGAPKRDIYRKKHARKHAKGRHSSVTRRHGTRSKKEKEQGVPHEKAPSGSASDRKEETKN
ncbi:unnamed protein product [Spodoptera littoralis]|uniref:Thioredoxin-like fold domain-containing protein n=1 Tax=Spodoptera littoralis TaxID=7109 RepID=A0A9P0I5L6_SPOLI|nr:unnamed protein product [Spodoptera littoralis]CAH1640609.1 unnamed protein product [Spodoptera littoralis]